MKKIYAIIITLLLLVACKKTTIQTYKIIFDQGFTSEEILLEQGKNIVIPDDPIREGYVFDWWYLDSEYTSPLDVNYIPTSSLTIFAKWIANEYTITFNSNGGTTFPALTIKHDEVLPNTYIPTKKDYTFQGWYLDSNLLNPFSFTTAITSSLSLYAKWEEIIHPLLDLEDYKVDYIVTNLGETNNSMRINYQARNTKTSLEYTLASDEGFINATTLFPTMYYFESLSEAMEIPFPGRNICRVEITNLLRGATYLYRINQGNDTYTSTYSFKTEALNDSTTFLFMTDIHYYDGFDGAEVSEEVIKEALNYNPNIDFLFNTGDIVDTGGNAIDWEKYFTFAQSLKTLPVMGVPGNHEHYFVGEMRNKIYASYFNYPQNGIDTYLGASYYFIHNDTLFIQVDTDSPYEQGRQLEWMEEVIKNNPTKFIIVGTHAPVNETWSIDYNRPFMALMEKYAVDLVLAGHYHSQVYSLTYLDKAPTNPYQGVAYFRGAGGGIKGAGSIEPKEFAKGYIISVKESTIEIQTINGNGKLGAKYIVTNKKIAPYVEATKEEIMNSFTYNTDFTNEVITFNWTPKSYKNVKEIKINQDYREMQTYTTIVPTPGYYSYSFSNLKEKLDHSYTIEVIFLDGKTSQKNIIIKASPQMNLRYIAGNDFITLNFDAPVGDNLTNIKRYEIYVDKQLFATLNAKDENFQAYTSYNLRPFDQGKTYEITVNAIGRNGFMYSEAITVSTNP